MPLRFFEVKKCLSPGLEDGEERGLQKERTEIARNLLKARVNMEIISQTTGLTKEEIEKLK